MALGAPARQGPDPLDFLRSYHSLVRGGCETEGSIRRAGGPGGGFGASLLVCASASALAAQTITFTSAAPSRAVAGGSYTVSATDTSGGPVVLTTGGACSLSEPRANAEEPLEAEVVGTASRTGRIPSDRLLHWGGDMHD